MNINDVRTKYLEFFQARGHVIVPSASIVPQNDPTTLFTGSGMQPILPYLLGEPHPEGTRITDSQKSFRAEDIDEVGDNRHTTFFEMLGNWSFGDYFKAEQLPWIFSFLTDEIGLDPKKFYVTVFIGDEKNNLPRDTESVEIWKRLFAEKGVEANDVVIGSEADGYKKGMHGGRIFYYDAKKNWWSRAGSPEKMPAGEPGGPDSEIFYDFGGEHDEAFGERCHPNCDCGRFMEICNSVFMQYIKRPDGTFALLPQLNVDFGGGLERIAAASNDNPDVFETDVFQDIIQLLAHFSGKRYDDAKYRRSFRIVADHIRAATIMLADGVRPSNTERGYILRRLIRRASQHAQKIGVPQDQGGESLLNRCAVVVIEKYKNAYPELATEEMYKEITGEIWKEEVQFGRTLEKGLKEFERLTNNIESLGGNPIENVKSRNGVPVAHIKSVNGVPVKKVMSGNDAFVLFTTYGFPLEMTIELMKEKGLEVDVDGFKTEFKKHQELSRAGATQKFAGGLADHSEKTTRLHTAHHLLLRALQEVLGPGVKQRGSNITQERLRIDFSYGQKMTKEQLLAVENMVNEKIQESVPMTRITVPKEVAEKSGAEQEFGAKYPDMVSVYIVGPVSDSPEEMLRSAFSKEFCGGPHVTNTRELQGVFKIQKEEAVAAGVRRIKAVLV